MGNKAGFLDAVSIDVGASGYDSVFPFDYRVDKLAVCFISQLFITFPSEVSRAVSLKAGDKVYRIAWGAGGYYIDMSGGGVGGQARGFF